MAYLGVRVLGNARRFCMQIKHLDCDWRYGVFFAPPLGQGGPPIKKKDSKKFHGGGVLKTP
jgi:hypothetical protein